MQIHIPIRQHFERFKFHSLSLNPGDDFSVLVFFNLKYFKKDLTLFVHNLEEIIIETLNVYNISGNRVKKHRGVYAGTKKIASIGLKVRKWITIHGLSLNINIDLSYFENIVACGLKDFPQTSISEILGKDIPINNVKELMQKSFENIFNMPFNKIQG